MKNVRVWFKKDYECRYISHLDLNRCMLRALHKSKLPVWHTEGFNPHPFASFALPLSLGFRGINECMDIKLEDDNFPFDNIISDLNDCLPRGLRVFSVTYPLMKSGKIAYASFSINLFTESDSIGSVCAKINEFMSSESILIEKKTKKGMKTIDIKHGITRFSVCRGDGCAKLDMVLSAGSTDNVNPNLFVSALEKRFNLECYADITRTELYDAEMRAFR